MQKLYNAVKLSILYLTFAFALSGCSGNDSKDVIANVPVDVVENSPSPEATVQPTAEPSPIPQDTPVPTEDLSGKAMDMQTGLLISQEAAKRRPFAVVINNRIKALPQSGISQADIYYEVLAEGDITRLVCIFQDFDSKKIGPIRSTRDYFIDFALDNNAVFVHHGGSDSGYIAAKTLKINRFDGQFDEDVFWRDPVRLKQAGMYEHSSYSDSAKILAGATKRKFNMERYEDETPTFEFYPEATSPINSKSATKLTVPFSPNYTSVFAYDEATKTYKKFHGDNKHMDEESGTQLEVTNVIVQMTTMKIIAGDEAGRRKVDLVSSGKGFLITNGVSVPLTWSKKSHTSPTEWKDENGNKLKLNKGKTWICVYDSEPKVE